MADLEVMYCMPIKRLLCYQRAFKLHNRTFHQPRSFSEQHRCPQMVSAIVPEFSLSEFSNFLFEVESDLDDKSDRGAMIIDFLTVLAAFVLNAAAAYFALGSIPAWLFTSSPTVCLKSFSLMESCTIVASNDVWISDQLYMISDKRVIIAQQTAPMRKGLL